MALTSLLLVVALQAQPAPGDVPGELEPGIPPLSVDQVRRAAERAPAAVDVRSQMGKHFRFVEAAVFVDGNEVYHRTANPGEELERVFRAYDGTLNPGQHEVSVTLSYVGRNTGPFTYLDDYHYRLAATSTIAVTDTTRPAAVDVVTYERSGFNVPIDKKPAIELKAAPGSAVVPVPVVRPEPTRLATQPR